MAPSETFGDTVHNYRAPDTYAFEKDGVERRSSQRVIGGFVF